MRALLAVGIALLASTPALGAGHNVPGIVAAAEPSPGLVLLLPKPGEGQSADAESIAGRKVASEAVAELLEQPANKHLLKSARIYHTLAAQSRIDQPSAEQLRPFIASCRVEAAADLPAKTVQGVDYYVVQMGCPSPLEPKRKMFVAVGITQGSVNSIFVNEMLTPVWSERE